MTSRQAKVHQRAKVLSQQHGQTEYEIIEILNEVQETKLYLEFGLTSVYQYAVEFLEFDDALAYTFVNVARKAKQFPELQRALKEQRLSVSKAARIASTLTEGNARELVQFAATHSKRETEREVARINPKAMGKNSVKQISEDYVQVTITMPRQVHEYMKRVQDIHGLSQVEALERVYTEHLDRHDPVRKAERNRSKEFCPGRIGELNAAEKHAVNARDRGQCTELDSRGKRCPNRRWLETHHIIQRSNGGTNALSNLTTLCWHHHQQRHIKSAARPHPA